MMDGNHQRINYCQSYFGLLNKQYILKAPQQIPNYSFSDVPFTPGLDYPT
jgi:hypothetical protein